MLDTAIALNRFGLGARPGDTPPADPKSWLTAQFSRFQPRPQALAQVPARSTVIGQLADYIAQQRMDGRAKRQMQPASLPTGAAPAQADAKPDPQADPLRSFLRQTIREDYLTLNSARLWAAH